MKRFLLLLVWILFLSNFLFAWSVWHVLSGGKRFGKDTANWIVDLAKMPSEFYHEALVFSGKSKSNLLIRNLLDSNRTTSTRGLLLLSTVNDKNNLAEIQLIDLPQGKILKKWQPDFSQFNLEKISKWNTRITHPILSEASITAIVNGSLVRMDDNSKIIWTSKGSFHHSIELDGQGDLWVCGTIEQKKKRNSVKSHILDDGIFKLDSKSGKVLYQKSIYDLMMENGYQHLLNYLGPLTDDPLHVNDIQPALTSSKYWQKGDLLISLRHRSTVFLYRPATNKILWLKTGPWTYQHDCDFLNDHEIGVFGNDVIRVNNEDILTKGHNNQYIYNFETDQVSTPYTKMFQEGKIKTLTEGRSRILPDGQLYVEETNYGRILFGDKNGVNGVYVSRIDKEYIAMLGWSRYYTREEYQLANKKTK